MYWIGVPGIVYVPLILFLIGVDLPNRLILEDTVRALTLTLIPLKR